MDTTRTKTQCSVDRSQTQTLKIPVYYTTKIAIQAKVEWRRLGCKERLGREQKYKYQSNTGYGSIQDDNPKYLQVSNKGIDELTINQVTCDDAGMYECLIKHPLFPCCGFLSTKLTIEVDVTGKCYPG